MEALWFTRLLFGGVRGPVAMYPSREHSIKGEEKVLRKTRGSLSSAEPTKTRHTAADHGACGKIVREVI